MINEDTLSFVRILDVFIFLEMIGQDFADTYNYYYYFQITVAP